ncbi:uncharacterized protein B0I36DRAFT_343841 [Microdochium trichocladiopsis]|uniref:MYND-type domain-containing protein n=1 Tax=Microdochium trichocladiopsis TaxID=1682393 RepID=A0A9P8YHH4_9PEZI|nr:uncharacterized protein B0I36DRAFT_343841 [Microdochium trichocladiopsis]KAH7040038.1 hypothetical protein B0I36DRAFT_343841 [Microdochium trichocladiopsis]
MSLLNPDYRSGADYAFLVSRLPPDIQRMHAMGIRNVTLIGFDPTSCVYFWRSIADLAMQKTPAELMGQTATARQLRFYKWIVRGRNDADMGMQLTGHGGTDAARQAASLLPGEEKRGCGHCGWAPAQKEVYSYCAGCVIESQGRRISCMYYCSRKCQEDHWPTHKTFCTTRKKVVRAAHLIQKLMYAIEAAGAQRQVESLEVRDGVTHLHEVPQEELVLRGGPILNPVAQGNASQEAYHAALTGQTCNEIVIVGRQLLNLLIDPYCRHMEVITIVPRNAVNPLGILNASSKLNKECYMMIGAHKVIRLHLASGETLLLDISGAQYGWREPVAPWDKWCRHRAAHVNHANAVHVSDTIENKQRMLASYEQIRGERLRRQMAQRIQSLLSTEAAQRKLPSVLALLGLPGISYNVFEQHVVQAAQQACLQISQSGRTSRRGL